MPNNLFVGRVLSEDDDFMVIELGKHDQVSWQVAPIPGESEDRDPPRFFTMAFCKPANGGKSVQLWDPFEQAK